MTATENTPNTGDNYIKAREAFFQRCRQLGEQEGQGLNVGATFMLEVIREARIGTIGMPEKEVKGKRVVSARGTKNDDAVIVYNTRMEGLRGKAFWGMKERSLATRHAQTRTFIRMGAYPHGDMYDLVVNTFVPLWEQEAKLHRKGCFDIVEATARLGRVQVHLPQLITDKQELLDRFIRKPAGKAKELVDEEEAIAERLQRLIDGGHKGSKHQLMDNDDKIVDALDSLKARIAELRNGGEEQSEEVSVSEEVAAVA
jgi:hypothetical protein